MNTHVMPTYARLPITFAKGEGVWLWDEQGNRYLDAVAGIAVCGLGHAHPEITAAIADQAGKLIHTSNLYRIGLQEQLANELCELSNMDSVFFGNSGAEANEAAIKLARKYGHSKGIDDPVIIVMEGGFHGRTLATLSATGNPKVQDGFEPLVGGFLRVPYNSIASIEAIDNPNVVAVLVEPVQGEGGVRVPASDYLAELRALCTQRDWLLMLDEIQTGIGRTGCFFAYQHAGILPDVCTLAKALGNGVPIGACLARGIASTVLTAGKHGSTFGGNPLACRAALAVLKVIRDQKLQERARQLGHRIVEMMRERLRLNSHVVDIRHHGLMIGIELDRACGDLVTEAIKAGLLINVTAERTVRLLPPLVLTDEETNYLVERLTSVIDHFTADQLVFAPEAA